MVWFLLPQNFLLLCPLNQIMCSCIYKCIEFLRQDTLGQFSMVNLELYNIVEDIKKVSKAFVVHPKNVNAENAASNCSLIFFYIFLVSLLDSHCLSIARLISLLCCCIRMLLSEYHFCIYLLLFLCLWNEFEQRFIRNFVPGCFPIQLILSIQIAPRKLYIYG